jgi:hypothetical protein
MTQFHPNQRVALGEAPAYVAFDPGGAYVYVHAAAGPRPVLRKFLAPSEVETRGDGAYSVGPRRPTLPRRRLISPCLQRAA